MDSMFCKHSIQKNLKILWEFELPPPNHPLWIRQWVKSYTTFSTIRPATFFPKAARFSHKVANESSKLELTTSNVGITLRNPQNYNPDTTASKMTNIVSGGVLTPLFHNER